MKLSQISRIQGEWTEDLQMNTNQPIHSNGKFYIYDPCFWDDVKSKFLCVQLDDFLPGRYMPFFQRVELPRFNERVMFVGLVHESQHNKTFDLQFTKLQNGTVGVDTGRVTITSQIPSREPTKLDDDFYQFFPDGLICDSGIGDGTYDVYTSVNGGKKIALGVYFGDHTLLRQQ
jgi:hypothetical protein